MGFGAGRTATGKVNLWASLTVYAGIYSWLRESIVCHRAAPSHPFHGAGLSHGLAKVLRWVEGHDFVAITLVLLETINTVQWPLECC